ncbi:MAG: PA3496 family putative envelope integrity protein [Pseudomonas sp.]
MFRHFDATPAALVARAPLAPHAAPVTPASQAAQDTRAAFVTRTVQEANAAPLSCAIQDTRAAPVADVARRVARPRATVTSVANVPRGEAPSEVRTQRKLLDQKRMAYRRAIEDFAEQRRLQRDLAVFPDCSDLLVELLAEQQVNAA